MADDDFKKVGESETLIDGIAHHRVERLSEMTLTNHVSELASLRLAVCRLGTSRETLLH